MAACKTKWTHVRDQFRKTLRKRKLGWGSTYIRKYKYEDLLQFLVPHLAERDGVPLQDLDDDADDDDNENGNSAKEQELWNPGMLKIEHDTDSVSSVDKTQLQPPEVVETRKRKTSISSDCPSNSEMFAHLFGRYEKRKKSEDQHPMDAFLAGISTTLKSFDPVQQNRAKSKIFTIVQEMELEHLTSLGIAET
ncbi:unnamed protein product [Nesidiocoris tenuis]|nr:unnamed protein product [Nesidiocoris tenuis]CAB0009171.1 unnamed protein product [Nesidiocoris tenuis]